MHKSIHRYFYASIAVDRIHQYPFSDYIISIRNTQQRTREQLIALYRYWLRTGVDQKSLAAMFGNETKQNEISCYLDQIRTAIYKDFVCFFLGAHQNRDFYLSFNAYMTHRLHSLDKDYLVLIADGTYSRIEKATTTTFNIKLTQCKN